MGIINRLILTLMRTFFGMLIGGFLGMMLGALMGILVLLNNGGIVNEILAENILSFMIIGGLVGGLIGSSSLLSPSMTGKPKNGYSIGGHKDSHDGGSHDGGNSGSHGGGNGG